MTSVADETKVGGFQEVIRVDREQLRGHLREMVRESVEVKLSVPRLRKLPLETEIIERYRRKESSVEESLIQMYLAGVSVRRVEDIIEALWGQPHGLA
jgi:putative transposase